MRVPLTTRDFLDRAELVYGDRVGIVDEPTQPAPSLGDVSYRDVARRARAMQAALDALGIAANDAVMVGDSLEEDIEGARALGMRAILVDREDRHPEVEERLIDLYGLPAALGLPRPS